MTLLNPKDKNLPLGEDLLDIIADMIREIAANLPSQWDDDENSWVWNMRVDVDMYGAGYKAGEIRAHPDGFIAFYPEGWS